MARLRKQPPASGTVRDALITDLEAKCLGRPGMAKHFYQPLIERLRSGESVVLRGWRIDRYRNGSPDPYGWYRLGADGVVVKVEAVRDEADPSSIIDWVEVS